MSNRKLKHAMKNPELNAEMIKDAYSIMDKIEKLENIERDETSSQKRRRAAAKEKEFQMQDLEKFKTLMRESKSNSTQIIYYKYIEGYTLQEVADHMNLSTSYIAKLHADFRNYLKNPDRPKPKSVDLERVSQNLDVILKSAYK